MQNCPWEECGWRNGKCTCTTQAGRTAGARRQQHPAPQAQAVHALRDACRRAPPPCCLARQHSPALGLSRVPTQTHHSMSTHTTRPQPRAASSAGRLLSHTHMPRQRLAFRPTSETAHMHEQYRQVPPLHRTAVTQQQHQPLAGCQRAPAAGARQCAVSAVLRTCRAAGQMAGRTQGSSLSGPRAQAAQTFKRSAVAPWQSWTRRSHESKIIPTGEPDVAGAGGGPDASLQPVLGCAADGLPGRCRFVCGCVVCGGGVRGWGWVGEWGRGPTAQARTGR